MTRQEVIQAIGNKTNLFWNDPDPIEGNDYKVQKVWDITEETVMIQYGSDDQKYFSEAEVYLTELKTLNKT